MKSILLTTTAIVAFAGAAAADGHAGVALSGDFQLGFNDDIAGDHDGFYWDGDINVAGTAALDNGVTAGASFEIGIADDNGGNDLTGTSLVLSLESENAGLFLGNTSFAAETLWSGAGDMEADGFSAADGEIVLRGDVSFGDIDTSVSYTVADAGDDAVDSATFSEEVDQLSVAATGTFGMFTLGVAYQEESVAEGDAADPDTLAAGGSDPDYYDPDDANGDFNTAELFGISAGVAVAGADITLAYASDETAGETSTGIQVAYPFGPVTATVYYVSEDDASGEDNYGVTVAYSDGPIAVTLDYDYDQGVNKVALDGSYDVGNGFTVLAGFYDESDSDDEGTDAYIAGTYDLGGGAELLVSYADAERLGTIGDDEVGGPDYQVGTTVAVSFSF